MGWLNKMAFAGDVLAEFLGHEVGQLVLGDGLAVHFAPLLERLEHDVGVRHVHAHRVGGDFRRADAAERVGDFRKFLQQHLLAALLHVDAGVKADAGGANHVRGERAFVELRDELRAQPAEHEHGQREQRHRASDTSQRKRKRKVAAPARKAFFANRISEIVFLPDASPLSRYEQSAGMSVSASTSAPTSAKMTVMAIGLNIFPSMPVSARIGK